MSKRYDVIVCGAGVSGMAMAMALAKKRIATAMIAPKYQAKANLGQQYHPRIYAISLASQKLLLDLDIWQMLPEKRLTAVKSMRVFGDLEGEINLDSYSAMQTPLAWIVESGEIEAALQNALRFLGVDWIDGTVQGFQRSAENMTVTLNNGDRYQADLLIGADGANSVLRQAAGIKHQVRPYDASGLVAQLTVEKPHENVAYQWFTDEGILAFLPLPDTDEGHQVSMVWSAPDAIAQELSALAPEELARILPLRLASLSRVSLGEVQLRSPMFSFPLTMEQTDWVAEGIALIGDAAHRLHPLAGQGLNLGLGDVASLSELLAQKESFRRYGDLRVLQRYQRARIPAMLEMKMATDGLFRLFNRATPTLALVRNLGMRVCNKVPSLKRLLMHRASGL